METTKEIREKKGCKRLTIEELRGCKGFEHYTDEQAEKTIRTLETLSILFYELYMRKKQREKNLRLLKQEKHHEEQHRNVA
jgi:hypothetical protein